MLLIYLGQEGPMGIQHEVIGEPGRHSENEVWGIFRTLRSPSRRTTG